MSEYRRFTEKVDSGFVSELDCRIAYNRLSGLEDKIESGTLVELPCKVGDTVYYTDGENIYEAPIKKIIYDLGNMAFDDSAINQSIFLTKEAAEARLKELQERRKDD